MAAVEEDRLYVFTQPDRLESVQARFDRILNKRGASSP